MDELGKIEGHLKVLNGTVARNIKDINKNASSIKAIAQQQNKMLGATGAIGAMFIIIGGALAKIFLK